MKACKEADHVCMLSTAIAMAIELSRRKLGTPPEEVAASPEKLEAITRIVSIFHYSQVRRYPIDSWL